MKLEFTKMQACGNDYVYVDCFCKSVDYPAKIAKNLSIRRFSVGSDGLVLIMPSDEADAKMKIFNSDGSEAKMCGNAIRCVAKYLYDTGTVKRKNIDIETPTGVKRTKIVSSDGKTAIVSVEMGRATFIPQAVPVVSAQEVLFKDF